MSQWYRGKALILLLAVVLVVGGSAACQKGGDVITDANGWAKIVRIKRNPVRIGPLVRESKGSDSFFRADITNVSKVTIQHIDGTSVLLSEEGFVVEARAYSERLMIPPDGKVEMKIPFSDPRIHSAIFVLKQATYIAGTTSGEPKEPIFSGWANKKYDAELGAAKNYPPGKKS